MFGDLLLSDPASSTSAASASANLMPPRIEQLVAGVSTLHLEWSAISSANSYDVRIDQPDTSLGPTFQKHYAQIQGTSFEAKGLVPNSRCLVSVRSNIDHDHSSTFSIREEVYTKPAPAPIEIHPDTLIDKSGLFTSGCVVFRSEATRTPNAQIYILAYGDMRNVSVRVKSSGTHWMDANRVAFGHVVGGPTITTENVPCLTHKLDDADDQSIRHVTFLGALCEGDVHIEVCIHSADTRVAFAMLVDSQ